ncbi:MAG: GDP-mannose 4,6-dehydratase [Candidatus Omnitrophica bacterium]|nr:GDP-mannose 4,6-dehydratase [Candidatus Omnitrophota bacterium]MDD5670007.1 GDP-mannose 4,6-dehydratase [Candidatus Omnitrophota bacterium]
MKNPWKNKKVLVTGAGGFIGSHLAECLVTLGARTKALVHYHALGTPGWLNYSKHQRQMKIIAGDITDRDTLVEAMKGVETVFHLAALIAIPYSYQALGSYVRTNVQGTLNVLQVARRMGVRRVVHTSTSEVYGTAKYVPIDEAHPLQGQSPYAASKIGADKMVEAFYYSFGLDCVVVRPFNTFGPRQSLRAIVPTIIMQCLTQKQLHLGNLYPTRDMNYVEDIVRGFLLAGALKKASGKVINLGGAHEISIRDLVKLIGKLMDRKIVLREEARRVRPLKSEVDRLVADSTLAGDLLGWHPKISLQDGLKKTIAWFRKNNQYYHAKNFAI